ncbi:MAG: hypothetical protein DME65_12105 [Verrucomicrobia bacterium]|nr:MAG: hypothetical protein DME65_12105 [Verrucomicrobiota bacterium]
MSVCCLKSTANKLARNSNAHHNTAVKTVARPSRLGAWSVRCVGVTLALAFCASAFADPSKEVVLRPQPQRVVKTAKKMCYVVTGDSRIPQPCERLAAIPTTHGPMDILGHRNTGQ